MIFTLIGFICSDVSVLLAFMIFCLSDFVNNCKSNVDIISNYNLALYHHHISSPDSPDSKSLSFRTHA